MARGTHRGAQHVDLLDLCLCLFVWCSHVRTQLDKRNAMHPLFITNPWPSYSRYCLNCKLISLFRSDYSYSKRCTYVTHTTITLLTNIDKEYP